MSAFETIHPDPINFLRRPGCMESLQLANRKAQPFDKHVNVLENSIIVILVRNIQQIEIDFPLRIPHWIFSLKFAARYKIDRFSRKIQLFRIVLIIIHRIDRVITNYLFVDLIFQCLTSSVDVDAIDRFILLTNDLLGRLHSLDDHFTFTRTVSDTINNAEVAFLKVAQSEVSTVNAGTS